MGKLNVEKQIKGINKHINKINQDIQQTQIKITETNDRIEETNKKIGQIERRNAESRNRRFFWKTGLFKDEEREYELKLIEQLYTKDIDNNFIELVKAALTIARKKKNRNKRFNFIVQFAVIGLAGLTTVATSYLTLEGNAIVKFIAIVAPAATTALLAIYNLRKYEETWLRHSNRYNNLMDETARFINLIDTYGDETQTKEKGLIYKINMMSILANNRDKFNNNMNRK